MGGADSQDLAGFARRPPHCCLLEARSTRPALKLIPNSLAGRLSTCRRLARHSSLEAARPRAPPASGYLALRRGSAAARFPSALGQSGGSKLPRSGPFSPLVREASARFSSRNPLAS